MDAEAISRMFYSFLYDFWPPNKLLHQIKDKKKALAAVHYWLPYVFISVLTSHRGQSLDAVADKLSKSIEWHG